MLGRHARHAGVLCARGRHLVLARAGAAGRTASKVFKPVDTAAALASGSTTRPPLSQPWARVLPVFLGSGPSPFEATRQPSKGRPETEDLRPDPLAGTACSATLGRWACACT